MTTYNNNLNDLNDFIDPFKVSPDEVREILRQHLQTERDAELDITKEMVKLWDNEIKALSEEIEYTEYKEIK